jgi:hypothetical protein
MPKGNITSGTVMRWMTGGEAGGSQWLSSPQRKRDLAALAGSSVL